MSHHSLLAHLARAGVVSGTAGVLLLGWAGTASAHVTITPSTTVAGGYAVLTLSVPHGCEGSSTTGITIQVPEEIRSVTPTRNPLWDVAMETVALDPAVTDSDGNTVTERVASITYRTDTPLPEGYRDTFDLSLQLPDSVGSTLAFPVIQTCEEGEAAWIEVPASGQEPDDLELPAPSFAVTSGEAGVEVEGADATAAAPGPGGDASDADTAAAVESPASAGGRATSLAALGLAVVGVVLGGAALARQLRRT